MTTFIESLSTSILLIILIIFLLHLINGTAIEWVISKVKAEE